MRNGEIHFLIDYMFNLCASCMPQMIELLLYPNYCLTIPIIKTLPVLLFLVDRYKSTLQYCITKIYIHIHL